MRYTALAALAALGVSSTAALAVDSSVTMTSSMPPDALWKKARRLLRDRLVACRQLRSVSSTRMARSARSR